MKAGRRQSGLTLIEMTVVILVAALLTSLSLPAVRSFFSSMAFSEGAESMISAALASARAVAAKEQRYAGVRFQEDMDGHQYMIFIVQDPGIGAYFFRAVDGVKPIKLPDGVGVMDLKLGSDGNKDIGLNDDILFDWQVTDTTSFSIIFSPSGKLIVHDVRVRNRDGEGDYSSYNDLSQDDVFNKKTKVDVGIGLFYQDDYFGDGSNPDLGLGKEPSRSCFVVYDKEQLKQTNPNRRWTDYLSRLEMIYINSYTGRMISRD